MKKINDQPVMTFQTNINGTFNPSFFISSGILRWIIDGEEQITNTPSKVLTGSTVDVQVFLNTVSIGDTVENTNFINEGIIGVLDFTWALLSGSCRVSQNTQLTGVLFSGFANTISIFQAFLSGISSLNFTNVVFSSEVNANSCPNLQTLTFGSSSSTLDNLQLNDCDVSALDLSSITLTDVFSANTNPNLAAIIHGSITTGLATFNVIACALPGTQVDLIFTTQDTFFSSNTPIKNLGTRTDGGTSDAPTAAGVAAIANLVSLYNTAGFTFTGLTN